MRTNYAHLSMVKLTYQGLLLMTFISILTISFFIWAKDVHLIDKATHPIGSGELRIYQSMFESFSCQIC